MVVMVQAAEAGVTAERRAQRLAGVAMDTLVTLEVLSAEPREQVAVALRRALDWFTAVERACSRFDPRSELRQLVAQVGTPVQASSILFEATRFALALARETRGAFDPTVGTLMESRGFDRDYRTGERTPTALPAVAASYRDVRLDEARRTITLQRPLLLDLGAVAKGLATDLAARELAPFRDFCVEAGGDLYAGGHNAAGRPWRVAVQDPRDPAAAVRVLDISDRAICTSGDYERRTPDGDGHHLVDPRSGRSAAALASVTVVAPTAMVADGLGTAAFILGPRAGLRLLDREGVGGLLVLPDGAVHETRGLEGGRG